MKHLKLFILVLLFSTFNSFAQPADGIADIEAVKESLKKLFSSGSSNGDGNFSLGEMKIAKNEEGERTVAGPVSMFGKGNLQLEAALQKERKKPSSIKINFPASAIININNIDALTNGNLKKYIPNGFPTEAGIAVKYLNIHFDTTGYKPTKIETSFSNGKTWELMGDGSLSVQDAQIALVVDEMQTAQKKTTANLSGNLNFGNVVINLASVLSTNKDDLKITGSVQKLSLANLLNAVGKSNGAAGILNAIPSFITNLELSSLTFDIIPYKKSFVAKANTTIGEMEILLKPGSGSNKMQVLMGVAPPSSFRFSNISSTLGLLDGINLNGTGFVISSFAGEVGSELNSLKTSNGVKRTVTEGLNVFTNISLGQELGNLLKVNTLSLYGSIDKAFNNVKFQAAFDFNDLKFGEDIYLRKVGFGISLAKAQIEFGLFGRLDAKISGDLLSFNAGFNFAPTDVELKAFFYMQALQKANAQVLQATLVNGEAEPPEWTDPFGIKGVGILKLGVQVGASPKSPIFINSLGFDARVRLGTVKDKNKHFTGNCIANINLTNPQRTLLDIQLQNLTPIGLIDAFKENHGITGSLRKMLDWGFEKAYLRVVPVAQDFLGQHYERGIAGGGILKLAGLTATCDFSASEAGITMRGDIDPIEYKSGSFVWFGLKGYNRPKPLLNLKFTADPVVEINGSITVLGITNNTNILINKEGAEFDISGNILNGALKASLHVKAQQLSESGGFYVKGTFENKLQTMVSQQLIAYIKRESAKSQAAYRKAQQDLQSARNKTKDPAAQFFIDAANTSVAAFKELDKGMAVAGEYVVKGLIENSINIKEMSFASSINKNNFNVTVSFDMIIAGQTIQQTVSLNLNISSLTQAAEQIVNQIKDVVINAFENLGSEIEKGWNEFVAGAGQFFTDVKKGFDVAGQEFIKAGAVAVNWFEGAATTVYNWGDELFNGAKVTPPNAGTAPGFIPWYVTRYQLKTDWIRVDQVPESTIPIIGTKTYPDGNELEIYGSIVLVPSGRLWTNNSGNQYSFNKRIGDAVSIAKNKTSSVNHSKYFYADDRNRTTNKIKVYSHLWESDHPLVGEELRSSGEVTFSNISPEKPFTFELKGAGGGQAITTHFTLSALPKISDNELINAINSRNTGTAEAVIRKGGNPTSSSVLQAVSRNDDEAMLNLMIRYGATPGTYDLSNAVNAGAVRIANAIIRYGVAPTYRDLDKALSLNNRGMVELLLRSGVQPNAKNVNNALVKNNREMAKLLLQRGVLVTSNELAISVAQKDNEMMNLLMRNGALPNQSMLIKTMQDNNTAGAITLLTKIVPDATVLEDAANKNSTSFFQLFTDNNGRITNNNAINKAIDNRNRDILLMGIQNGGDINAALVYALQKNDWEIATICLDNKANPQPAIAKTVQSKNVGLFNALLTRYKADPNECLEAAIAANNIDFARTAITTGRANPGNFIIPVATAGNNAMTGLLIDNGADPNKAMAPFIANKKNDMVAYLIQKGADARRPNYIQQAAAINDAAIVQLLIEKGADPDAAMPQAISKNNTAMATYLLNNGADPRPWIASVVNAENTQLLQVLLDKGATPDKGMPTAIQKGHVAMTTLLLERGASPQGYIQIPAAANQVAIVKLLLDKGAVPDPGLLPALQKNYTDIAKMLLEKGAEGNRYIDIPAGFGNTTIAAILLQRGADPEKGIRPAITNGHAGTAQLMINAGANGGKKEYLDLAVNKRFPALVPVLVKAGCKVDSTVVDAAGKTYLHIAANRDNNFEMVKQLLNAGSSVFAKDNNGNTPLHLAVDEGKDDIETVRLLLEKGADPCAENNKGRNIFKEAKGTKVKRLIKEFGGSRKCN